MKDRDERSRGIEIREMILLQENKKRRVKGGKYHTRTMMHSETDEVFKMNAHYRFDRGLDILQIRRKE